MTITNRVKNNILIDEFIELMNTTEYDETLDILSHKYGTKQVEQMLEKYNQPQEDEFQIEFIPDPNFLNTFIEPRE